MAPVDVLQELMEAGPGSFLIVLITGLAAGTVFNIQVAAELTNHEIGVKLSISKRTVDNHVSNIFTKTGAKNRVGLVNWAMDNGKICRDGFNCCSLEDGPGGVQG